MPTPTRYALLIGPSRWSRLSLLRERCVCASERECACASLPSLSQRTTAQSVFPLLTIAVAPARTQITVTVSFLGVAAPQVFTGTVAAVNAQLASGVPLTVEYSGIAVLQCVVAVNDGGNTGLGGTLITTAVFRYHILKPSWSILLIARLRRLPLLACPLPGCVRCSVCRCS